MSFWREDRVKARTPKLCYWCGWIIEPGEVYLDIAGVTRDNDFNARKCHPVCETLSFEDLEYDDYASDFYTSLSEWLQARLGSEEGREVYRHAYALYSQHYEARKAAS